MTEKAQKITEKTLLPISLVLSLMGGGVYVVSTQSRVEALEKDRLLLQTKQDKYADDIAAIKTSIAVIEIEIKALRNDPRFSK